MTKKKILVSLDIETINALDSLLDRTHTPRSKYIDDLVQSQLPKLSKMPRMIE